MTNKEFSQILNSQPNYLAAWEVRLAASLSLPENEKPRKRMGLLVDGQRNSVDFQLSNEDDDLRLVKWRVFTSRGKFSYLFSTVFYHGTPFMVFMHRVIARRMKGHELRKIDHVDHINHDTFDNRRENLRVGFLLNCQNRKSPRNKNGFFGVYMAESGRFRSQILHHRKSIQLGTFDTPEMAGKAYDEAAKSLGYLTRNFRED